jgi:anti-anti-sigma factor
MGNSSGSVGYFCFSKQALVPRDGGLAMSQLLCAGLLEVDQVGALSVVNFVCSEILDEQTVREVDKCLRHLAKGRADLVLLLNFGDVRCCGNPVLAELIRLQKKIKAQGGKLALCGLTPDLEEIFRITGLTRHFTILGDEAHAEDAFLTTAAKKQSRQPHGSRSTTPLLTPLPPKRPRLLKRNMIQPQLAH